MKFKINSTGLPIMADLAYMMVHYPNDYTQLPDDPIPVINDPCQWLMDIAPFTDRFGIHKVAVDTSSDPVIQYFNRDLNRRKWVNLQDPRVIGAIYYMAGQTVNIPGFGSVAIASPILTMGEAATFLNTPVAIEENEALRVNYASIWARAT